MPAWRSSRLASSSSTGMTIEIILRPHISEERAEQCGPVQRDQACRDHGIALPEQAQAIAGAAIETEEPRRLPVSDAHAVSLEQEVARALPAAMAHDRVGCEHDREGLCPAAQLGVASRAEAGIKRTDRIEHLAAH